MAIESIASVKSHFQTGDRPSQTEFENLIDTLGRATPIAIASAAEGGKTGFLEIQGTAAVTAWAFTTVGTKFVTLETTASMQTNLGPGAVGLEVFNAITTASARGHLGIADAGAVGSDLLSAITTASAQGHLGATAVGIQILEASSTAAANNVLGQSNWTEWTAVDLTNGGSNDLTAVTALSGLSGVLEIEITNDGMSLSGTSPVIIQFSDSTGFVTTSYTGGGKADTAGAVADSNSAGILVMGDAILGATLDYYAVNNWRIVAATNVSNRYMASGVTLVSNNTSHFIWWGARTLSGPLTDIRLTTEGGSDTFDNGTLYIRYRT